MLVPHADCPVKRRLWCERQVIIRCYGHGGRRASAAIPYIAVTRARCDRRGRNDNTTSLLGLAAYTGVIGREHPGEPGPARVDSQRRVTPFHAQARGSHSRHGAGKELGRPGAVFQHGTQGRPEGQDSQDVSSTRHGADSLLTKDGYVWFVKGSAKFRKCGCKYHNVEFLLAYPEPPMLFVYEQVVCMRICGSRPRLAFLGGAAHGIPGGCKCVFRPVVNPTIVSGGGEHEVQE